MAIPFEEGTSICNHCQRDIPALNFSLHQAHCARNLEKCKVCGDMVPKKYAEEHYSSTHAPVACSQCSEYMDRDVLDAHKGEYCPQRIATCEFCEFPLPAVDLINHQQVCGNRTERCVRCQMYVRLCERINHEMSCNGRRDTTVRPPRVVRPAAREERGPPRRPPREFSPRRVLFSVALAGIAVLLGSLFFQTKTENNPVE